MVNKLELSQMLQRDGRWAEALKSKNARIKVHRAGGMTRSDASDAAWAELKEAFPPLPPKPPAPEPKLAPETDLPVVESAIPDAWDDLPASAGTQGNTTRWLLRNFGLIVCPSHQGITLCWENARQPPLSQDTISDLREYVTDPYTPLPNAEFFQQFRDLLIECHPNIDEPSKVLQAD